MLCGASFLPAYLRGCILLAVLLTIAQFSLRADEASNWSVATLAGKPEFPGANDGASTEARFNAPRGIVVDSSGQIFVADTFNHVIRKIDANGVVSTFAGSSGNPGSTDGAGSAASFNSPAGLAIDNTGTLYVADMLNHAIRKITPSGTVTTLAGSLGNSGSSDGAGATARFQEPVGIAVDSGGVIYVADTGNSIIRKINPQGVVSTLAGSAGETGLSDGEGRSARFNGPYGIAVDSSGTIYVADTFNHCIRKVTGSGTVTTFAGVAGHSGNVDGFINSARFSGPSALAVSTSGDIYVTEIANHLVRVISFGIVVSTVAGSSGNEGGSDGVGTNARFQAPQGVSVGSPSTLYVSDTLNNSVRKLTRSAAPSSPSPESGDQSKLTNISTRSFVSTSEKIMIAGFIISGNDPKQVLIRASGPGLSQFGVSNFLSDPRLVLYSSGRSIAANDDWSSDKPRIEAARQAVHAFSWAEGSKDAALILTLPPGGYTAQVSDKNDANGVALIEVYDVDPSSGNSRLINISTRAEVRTNDSIMIAGFIISGAAPKKVLVRASGPALAGFGLSGYLEDPVLSINTTQGQIAENDDWGSHETEVEAERVRSGAFLWPRGSRDAALVLTLPPGGYTALVRGKNGTTGLSLIEVFELP